LKCSGFGNTPVPSKKQRAECHNEHPIILLVTRDPHRIFLFEQGSPTASNYARFDCASYVLHFIATVWRKLQRLKRYHATPEITGVSPDILLFKNS
jgi:hypothetical protein